MNLEEINEYEFFNRMLNRICKDYDHTVANEFQNIFLKLEKENDKLLKENQELRAAIQVLNTPAKLELNKYKHIIEEIKNIDIFKEFSFPLMKRWEEQQVLSSINYQFKNTFIKKINELEKVEE